MAQKSAMMCAKPLVDVDLTLATTIQGRFQASHAGVAHGRHVRIWGREEELLRVVKCPQDPGALIHAANTDGVQGDREGRPESRGRQRGEACRLGDGVTERGARVSLGWRRPGPDGARIAIRTL